MADVTFRLDCSFTIGSGHLHRCLCLANEISAFGLACEFLVRPISLPLASYIEDCGHSLKLMSAGNLQIRSAKVRSEYSRWLGKRPDEDSAEVCALATSDILIVDHYGINQAWLDVVTKRFKRVCLIDDFANLNYHDVDLIISPNPYSREIWTNMKLPLTEVVTGAEAIFVKPIWYSAAARYQVSKEINKIVFLPGGTDPTSLVESVMPTLLSAFNGLSFGIYLGVDADRRQRLIDMFTGFPVNFEFNSNNIASNLCDYDLAVGTAGSGAWERCVLGIPQVCIRAIADQYVVAASLSKLGICPIVDVDDPEFLQKLIIIIGDLRINYEKRVRLANKGRLFLKIEAAKMVATKIFEFRRGGR